MLLLALVPAFTFHTVAVLILALGVIGILYWLVQALSVGPPLVYVFYVVIALVAIWLLFWLVGQAG